MSVQAALDFFHDVRRSPDLQVQVAAWGPAPSIRHLVELANRLGFACSAADLQIAFRHDWIMRWLHTQRK
ncbi:MAG: Nif11-like leader peptide family natural product precursor [Acidimicrobiales bacterium]